MYNTAFRKFNAMIHFVIPEYFHPFEDMCRSISAGLSYCFFR